VDVNYRGKSKTFGDPNKKAHSVVNTASCRLHACYFGRFANKQRSLMQRAASSRTLRTTTPHSPSQALEYCERTKSGPMT
jgi:hypothetical protein